jgi:ATP-dependent DNA helicase RecQ
VLVTGFDRENLYFGVQEEKNKTEYVLHFLEEHKGESGKKIRRLLFMMKNR